MTHNGPYFLFWLCVLYVMQLRDWRHISSSKPQRICADPVTSLAASVRLGVLVAFFERPTAEIAVYDLDESASSGVKLRYQFGDIRIDMANIDSMVFTDSPEAYEPPLLLVACKHERQTHVLDVSGCVPVYVGCIPVYGDDPVTNAFNPHRHMQTRGRTLAVGSWSVASVCLYEGYGCTWLLQRRLNFWGEVRHHVSRAFCIDNDHGDAVIQKPKTQKVRELETVILANHNGDMLAELSVFCGFSVQNIIPCEDDGWFVNTMINIVYISRSGSEITATVVNVDNFTAYIDTIEYVPGVGLFVGGGCNNSHHVPGGLVAFRDKRTMSKLRKAWCAAVVRTAVAS